MVLSEENNWTGTFTNLDKYAGGEEIAYTVVENEITDYEVAITGTKEDGYTVTNTHTPEKTEVSVSKVWDDADNQDGMRSESVTITLLANGESTGKTVVLNEENKWASTFTDLDKYAGGEEIAYTIQELEISGYNSLVTGSNQDGYVVTNTHKPITIDITVEKSWADKNNQDGIRPASITVNLLADGEKVDSATISAAEDGSWTHTFTNLDKFAGGKEINYTVTEEAVEGYSPSINGFQIVNTHNPSQVEIKGTKTWNDDNNRDGVRPESITITLNRSVGDEILEPITKTVTAADNWEYSFGTLDEYKDGKIIVYSITEKAVAGYDTTVDNYNVTNTHTLETIDVVGAKTWDDNDDQDGKRPETITINLLADGEKIDSVDVTEEDNWEYAFTGLDKYKEGFVKQEIVYTITEEVVDEYETEISDYEVINHHTPEKITYNIQKDWEDYDNNDGIRPESITVKLYANGEVIETLEISEEDNWAYTFTDLPRYANGEEIVYTITEDEVDGYETLITENVTENDENETKVVYDITIVNTHEKETTKIEGQKTWEDYDNVHNTRPETITIYLYKNDEYYDTITVSSESEWKYIVENLDKYENGEEIIYSIKELQVDGYTTTYDKYNIINTLEWGTGDGEVPPQTGLEVNMSLFMIIKYFFVSLVIVIMKKSFKLN